jgi:hypothetical protein
MLWARKAKPFPPCCVLLGFGLRSLIIVIAKADGEVKTLFRVRDVPVEPYAGPFYELARSAV